jgi:hypothetical protein
MMIKSPGKGMEHGRSFACGPLFTNGPLDVDMHLQDKRFWIPSFAVDELESTSTLMRSPLELPQAS